jgi:FAD/FMN-containing dehydrogenase
MEKEFIQSSRTVSHLPLSPLQAHIQGTVIMPGDPAYDSVRQAWNLSVDPHPAMVVVAESAADVAEAARYAQQAHLDVSVQSTGHGFFRSAEGGLLIVTSRIKTIRVDREAHKAWIGAGVKWGEVLAQTQAVGLAPLLGSSPDVGVVGYTLGGGLGWLGRKYGLATDSVLSFELVTADGSVLRASAEENSDLFWGLRGGGGSLGIVTGMQIRLYPVTTVYGGNLFYPVQAAREVFARYRDWIATAPDELTSSIVLMNFPPIPLVPEKLRGQSFVMVRGCCCGPIDQGRALVQPWREWRSPIIDDFKPMPFSQVGAISDDPLDPLPVFTTGAWMNALPAAAAEPLIRHCVEGPSPVLFAEVRHAGGAIARVPSRAAAFGNREAPLLLLLLGLTPTPEAREALVRHTQSIKEQLRPHLTGGVYMNFLEGEEARQRVRDGYSPEAYERLVQLKRAYDPYHRLQSGFALE